MTSWVVRDEHRIDEDTLASAAASQASLGELLARLRAVRYREVPAPDDETIAPWTR